MAGRPSKREIRSERGLSTAQVAGQTGVSQRTVQRYERGESKNETLSAFYSKMANANRQARFRSRQQTIAASAGVKDIRSMTDAELKYSVASEGRKARNRYKSIKSHEKEFSYSGDAIRSYENYVGHKAGKTSGKSRAQLQKDLANIRHFNEMKTSTVAGQKEAHNKRIKASSVTSGLSGDKNDVFWEVYNRVKEDPELYGYDSNMVYQYLGKQEGRRNNELMKNIASEINKLDLNEIDGDKMQKAMEILDYLRV